MRTLLLATTLLLAPRLAFCAPSCAIASAVAEAAVPPTSPATQPEGSALSLGNQAVLLDADRISRVPALRRISSNGAQLFDLGVQHGLQTVFARNGSTFQVFYLAPDGQAAIGGVMWDAAGHNVTRDQVAPIGGTIPTITIGTPTLPVPASSPMPVAISIPAISALKVAEGTTFGSVGVASAPRLYIFIDPLCSFSVKAMDQLRPYVAAGKLQLAVIPLSVLDYEDHGQSTVAAKSLLSLPSEQIVTAWRNQQATKLPPASPDADVLLERNMAAAQALALRGTPTMVWRKADGTEGKVEGIPDSIDTLIASMER